jgi:glycosyltransferase involved in cell wall biosynthesis
MAMGLPVVVSNVGGIAEIVDADTGFLLTAGDARQLSESVNALLASAEKRSALGGAGRRKVEEKFAAEKTAGRLLDLMVKISESRQSA